MSTMNVRTAAFTRSFARRAIGAAAGLSLTCAPFIATATPVINIIPTSQSQETDQNSEPSIAANPSQPRQIIVNSFRFQAGTANPYYVTQNGGSAWTEFQAIDHGDTSTDWSASGTAYAVVLLRSVPLDIQVWNSPAPNSPPNFQNTDGNTRKSATNDQPWIDVTLGADNKDQIYVGFNDVALPNNDSAAIRYSLDSGATWSGDVVLDNANPPRGNGPAVRVAAVGNRVYAVFHRFAAATGGDFSGNVVVVREDDVTNGVNFKDLSTGAINGVSVTGATPITIPYDGTSLGQERLGSDLSVAVDPRNPDKVFVAYADVSAGQPRVNVAVSTDAGKTWQIKLTRSNAALPALAVAENGVVGLLYGAIDNGQMEARFVQSANDFTQIVPGREVVLARFPQNNPPIRPGCVGGPCQPYVGDYFDLQTVGNTFHGTFSASNEPTPADFPQGALFQRYVKVGGNTQSNALLEQAGSLRDGAGNPVDISIDPYYFSTGAASKTGGISFSVDGGALNSNRIGPNPAEGLENVVGFATTGANDVYRLGTAPANGGAPGGHGLATEGEIFSAGFTEPGVVIDPTGENIDRISGALGNSPGVGPYDPVPAPSPATGAGVLGLQPNDNIDALSYGRDSGNVLFFSVSPDAKGAAGTDVYVQSTLSPGPNPIAGPLPGNPGGGDPGHEAAGDIFASQPLDAFGSYILQHVADGKTAPVAASPNGNALLFDERALGLQAPATKGSAMPGTPEDDVNALELSDPTETYWGVDYNGNGKLDPGERPVWFSLDPASPSLALVPGYGPQDIFVSLPGIGEDINGNGVLDDGEDLNGNGILDPFAFRLYADGIDNIGLSMADIIDAVSVSDVGRIGLLDPGMDQALFSLAPGSPYGVSPGDVFYTDFMRPFDPYHDWRAGGSLYASYAQLGLQFSDNLDALDVRPTPEPPSVLLLVVGLVVLLRSPCSRPPSRGGSLRSPRAGDRNRAA